MSRQLLGPASAIAAVMLTAGCRPAADGLVKGKHELSQNAPQVHTNRLGRATSPYLRQHAHNPVDWYEWGPEAFERARREDKPVFLSIGYAACHWCHVMAHESFANPEVAAVLNTHFISIKVDREERPDLDEVYMQATLVLNQGQGGWPMSVWLTPAGQPFFAGTYFPPAARCGRPGFGQLCERIAEVWKERRDELTAHAAQLTDVIQRSLQTDPAEKAELSLVAVDEAAEGLAGIFDPQTGGLISGGTNKFPPSMALDLMLRSAHRRLEGTARRKQLLQLVELTLDHMAAGGIYDQLGGGLHRYSTDVEWHVPHFEKMLYDQALVSRIYLDAYQTTRRPQYAQIAREICEYVLRELRAPQGGFFSSQDADSEGTEGKYYVWTRAEVLALLGPEDGELFCAHFDISASGNWDDPRHPGAGWSVPRRLRDADCCAKLFGISSEELPDRLARARAKLLAARAERVPPGLDDKILCEWNGLMIGSLARCGAVLDEPRFVAAAARAAEFILAHQCRAGRLHRSYRDGQVLELAFLSDYACLIEGLLDLYEATFEPRWLTAAAKLNYTAIEQHWDERNGGFCFTAADHEALIARSRDVRDNAVPSGNSVQLMNLLRLAALCGDADLRRLAERQMAAFASQVVASPWSSERFLAGVDFALGQPVEIVIVGPAGDAATRALLRQVHDTYLPNRVLLHHDPAAPQTGFVSPLAANRPPVDGRSTAYVCRGGTCQRPATTPAELAAALGAPR